MRKRNRFTRVYFKYITVLILGLMVVLGVVLFARARGTNDDQLPENSESTLPDSTDPVESADLTTEPLPTEPTISAVDSMKVTELMRLYYQAKVDDNIAALNQIVDSDVEYNDADVLSDAQFVDCYDDFNTYVMNGADEDSFIVYVKYNIYFKGISTGAAALNHFYVVRTESGDLVIYDRPLSEEQQAALTETENSEPVQRLKEQVEGELAEACELNPDLKYLMAMLNHTTVEESETETAAESAESPEEEPEQTSSEEAAPESAGEGGDSEAADTAETPAGE